MKILLSSICIVCIICSFNFFKPALNTTETVNPVLGDISFVEKFGHKPDANTNENLRIKTHLAYVENILRQKDVSTLSPELKQNRTYLLDALHTYLIEGNFPKNYDYQNQRKPCFIDRDGNICAVGYLIEKSAGRQTAEKINTQYQYAEIFEMDDDEVDNWIKSSGLTKLECAMIQPTYSDYVNRNYSISTSALSGVNFAMTTLNTIQLAKGENKLAIPVIGMVTGAGQFILGMSNLPDNYTYNATERKISMFNIGFGTATFILSSCNLIDNKKYADKNTSWNLFSYPQQDANTGMAFSVVHRF